MKQPRFFLLMIVLTTLPLLLACSDEIGTQDKKIETIEGEVFYRERMLLPPDATLTVTLEDVSRMDVPAVEISSRTYAIKTAPPYWFRLEYDPKSLDRRHRYALRARIEAQDHLIFTNMEQLPALAKSQEQPLRILVKRIPARSLNRAPAELEETLWKLEQIGNQDLPEDIGKQRPYMEIQRTEKRILGFAGCNSFTGYYRTSTRGRVKLTDLSSTRKMCASNMDVEAAFKQALSQAGSWKIRGNYLEINNDYGRPLLRFIAETK